MTFKEFIYDIKKAREDLKELKEKYRDDPDLYIGKRNYYLFNHKNKIIRKFVLKMVGVGNVLDLHYQFVKIKHEIFLWRLEKQGCNIYPVVIGYDEDGREIHPKVHMSDFTREQWSHDPK